MGQSPAGEDCNRLGLGMPLLNGPTEFGPTHPYPTQFTTDSRKSASIGDLLFCVRGSTTGRMNWADQEYSIGRGIAAIRHKKSLKLQPLIRAVIEYELPTLLQAATGSTFPNVSGQQLAAIPFPDLEGGEATAAIFGALDDKIELNRQMNETLEAMARAIFKDWFVDFGPTRAKMEGRAPYLAPDIWSLFPDLLDDDSQPEGWKTKRVGDVLERMKVGILYDQKSALTSGVVPILDQGKSGIIGYHNDEPNVRADVANRISTFSNHTCILRLIDFNFSTIQNVIPFRGKILPTEWVHYASEGKQIFEEYRGHWPSFVEHKITTPSIELAKLFADIIDPILIRVSANTLESKTLAATRDLLLPKLMSGEVRVRDAEALVAEVA
jgi:type I restriction enzyme S subunit